MAKSLLSSSWAAEGKETDDEDDEGESMKGFLATAREVWNDGGAAGFWQGVVPSLVMVQQPGDAVRCVLFLFSYGQLD